MYYVNPEKVVMNHVKENEIPQWDIAIMCFHSVEKTFKIVNYLGGRKIGYRLFSKCDSNMVFETEINHCKIGILGWCTGGGPLVASLIEEVKITGIKWLIGIGAAASIVDYIGRNEIILPTEIICNDGVSKYYCNENEIRIDKKIYTLVKQVLYEENWKYYEVKGATVEALYRQSEKMLQPWRNQNVQVVNWELGPFYSVSKECNIKCAWLGHVSDIEYEGKWLDWYSNREQITEKVMKICKTVIVAITEVTADEN